MHHLVSETGVASSLWLGGAILYAALVSVADSGGGSWAINGLFAPMRWSSDNQLAMMLADGLIDDTPRRQIVFGPWLATDRGPLLAALLTLPGTVSKSLTPSSASSLLSIVYSMAAITILASWVALIPWFCTVAGAPRIGIVLALAVASPFLLFNTVFVWPKLLGASYVLIALLLLDGYEREPERREWWLALIASCAVLAYLAHASNAFALVPLAVMYSRSILASGWRRIAMAVILALFVYAPWLYWQQQIQPGGNALVRYALSGNIDYHLRKPALADALATYQRLGVSGWVDKKIETLALSLNPFADWTKFGVGEVIADTERFGMLDRARVLDSFVVVRSPGLALLGLLVLTVVPLVAKKSLRIKFLRRSCIIGFSGLAFIWLATFVEPYTHSHSYGALLLLLLAGAVGISALPSRSACSVVLVAICYVSLVWIALPLLHADRLYLSGIVGMALGLLIIAGSLVAQVKDLSAVRFMSMVRATNPSATS